MRWAHSFAKFLPAEPEPRFSVRAFLLPGDIAAAEVCDSIAGIRACVAPSKGAELSSFQVRRIWPSFPIGSFHRVFLQIKDAAGDWLELLHHGNDYTSPLGPGGWQGRSTWVLFSVAVFCVCQVFLWSRPQLVPRCGS